MSAVQTAVIIAVCLCVAVLAGMALRRVLPEHHLNKETQDAVRLAMGLVATMSALLLGLLVSSAKNSYDTVRGDVIQMAANVSFLDRVLNLYGPDTITVRQGLRTVVQDVVDRTWSPSPAAAALDVSAGDSLYLVLQGLPAPDETRSGLKDRVLDLAVDLAHARTLMHAQSLPSISQPLLVTVVCWLMVIFFNFSLFAPSNAAAASALLVAALSVAGAIFLIVEMDQPFAGMIQVSNAPLADALPAINLLFPK